MLGTRRRGVLWTINLVLDVIPGDIDSFSLEAGTGVRFSLAIEGLCG